MPFPPPYSVNADELRVALSYFTKEVDSSTFIQPTRGDKTRAPNDPQKTDTLASTHPPPSPTGQPNAGGSSKKAKKPNRKDTTSAKPHTLAQTPAMSPKTAAAESTPTDPPTYTPPPPSIRNLQPTKDCASAKVIWASQAFDVPLETDKKPPTEDESRPVLTLHGEEISGGGNAMAMALSLYAASQNKMTNPVKMSSSDFLLQDEWCEWERTVLRVAWQKANKPKGGNDKPLTAALAHLDSRLQLSGGVWVVPGTFTVADIVLVSTLSSIEASSKTKFPAAVERYMQAHKSSWTKVQEALALSCKNQPSKQKSGGATGALSKTLPPMPTSPLQLNLDLQQPSLERLVDGLFRQVIDVLFGGLVALPATIVTKCANQKHGDYQCSAAMPSFASLKGQGLVPSETIKSPQGLAAAIIAAIGPDNPVVMEPTVNGPGFVTCRIRASLLDYHVNHFLTSQKLPLPPDLKPQVCVVDFSSPNIAKEMHVGHLRSTIIGESVCRILELVGHKVHRVNHVGDWGTQFGMLIQFLKDEYPNVSSGAELPNITDLTQFYKSAKQRFDESAEFKKQSQLNVVQLQSGDADCLRIWKLLCDISRKEFEKVYNRLDVTVEECGESFYNDKIPAVIEEFQKAGLLKEEEGGAKVVFTDAAKIPLMLQKSDGGYGYDSTDMAALKYRLQVLGADRVIVITDFSQADHFKMVYAAGHAIGWVNREQRLQHIGFGTVQGEDGKRFKTRSGDTVRLVDLLDEAASRLEGSLKKRITDGASHISLEEAHKVAEAIGYGSVKYFDLRRNPTSNYTFSYDMMLDTKGDTGVYLLYARVRLESILAKAQEEHGADLNNLGQVQLGHPSERNLALALQQFPDIVTKTLDDLFPYHICHYVYELSIAASDFVTQCRVLGSPEMSSRLLLCQAAVAAMKQSFDLLGIRHVQRI